MRAIFLLCLPSLAWAAPAMVTTTQGRVELVADGKSEAAPAAPFLFRDGMELRLGDGAAAVLLYDGAAKRLVGPTTATKEGLSGGRAVSGAGKSTSLLDEVLAVQHSQAQAGAHRGGVELIRPVPGGDLLTLQEIRWRCDGCSPMSVEVVDFIAGTTLWSGEGAGTVVYDGPALTGDGVQIAIGDERFTVYRADDAKRKNLEKVRAAAVAPMQSLEASKDGVGIVSVLTGLYVHIGLETDALYLADAAVIRHPGQLGFVQLREGLEQRVFASR